MGLDQRIWFPQHYQKCNGHVHIKQYATNYNKNNKLNGPPYVNWWGNETNNKHINTRYHLRTLANLNAYKVRGVSNPWHSHEA